MAHLDEYDEIVEDHRQEHMAFIADLIRTDPRGIFHELRTPPPIVRTPGFTIVTRFEEVQEVLTVIPVVLKRILLGPDACPIPSIEGEIEFQGGLFPERFVVAYAAA